MGGLLIRADEVGAEASGHHHDAEADPDGSPANTSPLAEVLCLRCRPDGPISHHAIVAVRRLMVGAGLRLYGRQPDAARSTPGRDILAVTRSISSSMPTALTARTIRSLPAVFAA